MIASACVVGAGIAGLATAIALERRGVDVSVYERAPALRSFGGALFFASNAVRALRALGLDDAALVDACAVQEMHFRAKSGDLLWSMPVGPASALRGTPTLMVPRASVLDLLSRALSKPVALGKSYVGHRERADGIEVEFEDGTRQSADLLVGADGARSRIRAAIRPELRVSKSAMRAFVGRSRGPYPELPPGIPSATGGHGPRFWAAPLPSGDVWWYALVNAADAEGGSAVLHRLFHDYHAPIPRVLAEADPTSIVVVEMFERDPCSRWSTRRATLVGDAAHCMLPDTGQGACQAFESALSLAKEVATRPDVGAALREYELSRIPRTNHVALLSRMISAHSSIETPLLADLRDLALSAVVPWLAPLEISWVLNGDRPR